MNHYRVRFENAKGQVAILPVNPSKLPTDRDTANSDYNVLGIGSIMVPRIPKLRKVSLSSYFPGRADLLTVDASAFHEPEYYINFFDSAMYEKEILIYTDIRVYENGTPYMSGETGMLVLVTNFRYEERGGETGDFYYELELTEYQDYSPATVTLTGATDTETGAAVATTEKPRSIPKSQIYVGAKVKVNGSYYYSSYGDEPHGSGNGRVCVISRIINEDDTRAYPVHINSESGSPLGWVKKDACQVVDSA